MSPSELKLLTFMLIYCLANLIRFNRAGHASRGPKHKPGFVWYGPRDQIYVVRMMKS